MPGRCAALGVRASDVVPVACLIPRAARAACVATSAHTQIDALQSKVAGKGGAKMHLEQGESFEVSVPVGAPASCVTPCLLGARHRPAAVRAARMLARSHRRETQLMTKTQLYMLCPPWHAGLARMAPPRAADQGPTVHGLVVHDFLFRVLVHSAPAPASLPRPIAPSVLRRSLEPALPRGFCLDPRCPSFFRCPPPFAPLLSENPMLRFS